MTIKKNYEQDEQELRRPARREVKNRQEQRMLNALRHGDLTVLDEDDMEPWDDYDNEQTDFD